jgi:arylsulfatase A-like enzyme
MTEMLTYREGEPFPGVIGRELHESVPAWPAPPSPPPGAPNVVFVVLDDVGYAQLGCYGSDIDTPNFDRLAASGLRFRNFHTTAMCSPTRASLLTGRSQHQAGMGGITDNATGFPGYNARIPRSCGFLSEMLVEQGYATFAVGKWHLAPREETDLAAPRARWPLGKGFERYYGFMGAETNQFAPDLVCDNHIVHPPKTAAEGYHLTEDLVDRSIEYVNDVRNAAPDKPFFLYLAFGACHAPHHAPREFIDRYRGRFDRGWDVWREETHARQLAMGLLPPGTGLTARPDWIPAWDSLDPEAQRGYARAMEVFAGFLTHTDHHLGRLLDHIEAWGDLDNTIVVAISDNGASPEGDLHGSWNSFRWYNGRPDTLELLLEHLDDLGGEDTHPHYPYGWAHAGNTPFQRWKREVHEGGVADPCILAWPAGIAARGEVRDHYAHVSDVVPTVLDLIGVPAPAEIDGVAQQPMAGRSLAPVLDAPDAPEVRTTQFYELLGCRAMYHDGWKAVAYHAMAGQVYDGVSDPRAPFDDDRWELYHVAEDPAETRDLAAEEPALLRRLIDLWWAEAGRLGALPVHSSRPVIVTRPAHYADRQRYVYRPGGPVGNAAAVDVRHRAHTVTATVDIPEGGAEGVLVSHGGRFGGYAFFVQDGHLHYVHNVVGETISTVRSDAPVPSGRVELAFTFTPTGPMAGDVALFVDGAPAGSGPIPATTPYAYNLMGEYLGIGFDDGTPVAPTYASPFAFTGRIDVAVVDVAGDAYLPSAQNWKAAVRGQ